MGVWTSWGVGYRYPNEEQSEPEPSIEELREALGLFGQLIIAVRSLAPPSVD
jgi:hypothetical protein